MKYEGHPNNCICDSCRGFYRSHMKVTTHDCADCRTHALNALTREPISKLATPARHGRGNARMATVNICDRCDTMYTSACASVLNMTTPDETITREICPGCLIDVLTILEGTVTTDRPRAYKTFPDRNAVPENETPAILEKAPLVKDNPQA